MTPSALLLFAALAVLAVWRGPLARFLDCCSNSEGWIRSEEAKEILAMMNKERVE